MANYGRFGIHLAIRVNEPWPFVVFPAVCIAAILISSLSSTQQSKALSTVLANKKKYCLISLHSVVPVATSIAGFPADDNGSTTSTSTSFLLMVLSVLIHKMLQGTNINR